MKTKPTEPRERYDRLVRAAQRLSPVTTAIFFPPWPTFARTSRAAAAQARGFIPPALVTTFSLG